MKKLIVSLFFASTILFAAPDCSYSYRFTNRPSEPANGLTVFAINGGTATTSIISNSSACTGWVFSYDSEGLSAENISLQSAPATFANNSTSYGTFVSFAGTVISGSNPSTATTSGMLVATGYYPFLRVSLNSSTGVGSINIRLSGYKSPTLVANSGGGGGSGSTTCATTTNLLSGNGSAAGCVDSSIAPSAVISTINGVSPTSNALLFSATSLQDVKVTITSTVFSVACSSAHPCIFNTYTDPVVYTSDLTCTRSGGSGNGIVAHYISSAGILVCDASTSNGFVSWVASAGAAVLTSTTPTYPTNALQIGETAVTTGAFAAFSNRTSRFSRPQLIESTGISISVNGGISVRCSIVFCLGGTAPITGTLDISAASLVNLPRLIPNGFGTKTLNTTSVPSGNCTATQTQTITGALAAKDAALVVFTSNPSTTNGFDPTQGPPLTIQQWIEDNTLNIKFCNFSTSAIVPGAAITVRYMVLRYE